MNGRPTKYHKSYPEKLLQHMQKGLSFRAFGAVVHVCEDTLHEWAKRHKDFSEAKKRGQVYLEDFYIRMGQTIATGQMRRLAREVPLMQGRHVVRDENDAIVYQKVYEDARTNAAAWIFMCKNMLGWRDQRNVEVGGPLDAHGSATPLVLQVGQLSAEDAARRYKELLARAAPVLPAASE